MWNTYLRIVDGFATLFCFLLIAITTLGIIGAATFVMWKYPLGIPVVVVLAFVCYALGDEPWEEQ